jgi:hypothetical protein
MTIILYKLDYLNNYIGLKINVLINNINKKKYPIQMVKITLINMKPDKNNYNQIYKPTKPNQDKYKIVFSSDQEEFVQFVLFVKFVNSTKLVESETLEQFKFINFPYNGIIYSCKITRSNKLKIYLKPMDLCARIIIKKQIITPIGQISSIISISPISWNKIFVINLPRRSDRKKQMEDFFSSTNINQSQYEFIEAFDGTDSQIQSMYYEKKKSNPSNSIITPGHFACLLSHLKAIRLAKSRGYKNVMILEDDVSTTEPDLAARLNSINLPPYDLLYLGGIMSKKKYFTTNWAYSGGTKIMGAYGYILSSKLFDIVLTELNNLDEYIDFYYIKNIQSKYPTIVLNDIIKTDLISSDTSHKSRIMVKRLDYIK